MARESNGLREGGAMLGTDARSLPLEQVAAMARPRRIEGISACLLSYDGSGRPDWAAFGALVADTGRVGLTPAVNMDTGYVHLLTPDYVGPMLGFELGTMFAPFGRIYSLDLLPELLQSPNLVAIPREISERLDAAVARTRTEEGSRPQAAEGARR